MDAKQFKDPGMEYRGVALWMLNDELEEDEIARQLVEFYKAGWGALITRTFNGLRTQYLGESWHRIVHKIIELAGERGMKVWLQAGYMPAGVPKLIEQEQHLTLVRKDKGSTADEGESLLLEDVTHSFFSRHMPHTLDLLNPEACANYMESAYSIPMEDEYADDMGKTVETVWVDEPHFNPPLMPWSRELPARFLNSWGYDIVPNLALLFNEEGDYRKVRHHYWRIILDMLLGSYFEEVSRWCEEHNVAFSGHLMGEDTLQAQVSWTAACMPCYEYMGLPGIDHLTRSLSWPAERSFIMTPKQCSSAANQLGQERKLAEMYGVSSQGLSFSDRKRIAEWIMMLGINYRCYHGSFYSMRGRRKRIYAAHLSYQQPWWEENSFISENFARFSYLMRQGTFKADILVLHPVESAFCEYNSSDVSNPYERVGEPATVRHYTDMFITLSENLIGTHRGFEYGDETMIAKHGRVDGHSICIGHSAYRIVVVPDTITLRGSTLALLREFVAGGGVICSVGETPQRMEGVVDNEISNFFKTVPAVENSVSELRDFFEEALPSYTRIQSIAGEEVPHIWLHERQVDGSRVVIVSNPTEATISDITIRVAKAGGIESWDTETGQVKVPSQRCTNDATEVETRLYPAGSAVYVFTPGSVVEHPPAPVSVRKSVPIDAEFSVERLTQNILTLDFCQYRKPTEEWSKVIPVVAVQEQLAYEDYQGPVSLRFTFAVDTVPESICVAIEDAEEYSILINDSKTAYAGLPYFADRSFKQVDIAAFVKEGENRIEISREFVPPSQPRFRLGSLFHTASGVELESVYLVGDFAVAGSVSDHDGQPKAVRFCPDFTVTGEVGTTGGNLLSDGYLFFAGRIALDFTIDVPRPSADERVVLCLPTLDTAVAKVTVNNGPAATVGWMPYEIDITESILPGSNAVRLELVTSLRNMLGPHHRPSGEPDQVWADGWTGLSESRRRDTKIVSGREWWLNRNSGEVFWTDDYFFIPLGVDSKMSLEYRSGE